VIVGYGAAGINGKGQRTGPPLPVKGMHCAMNDAVRHRGTAAERGSVLDIWERLMTVKCHRCEMRTGLVHKGNENDTQSVDRNSRLCTTRFDKENGDDGIGSLT
jgi:hypothetical protein